MLVTLTTLHCSLSQQPSKDLEWEKEKSLLQFEDLMNT